MSNTSSNSSSSNATASSNNNQSQSLSSYIETFNFPYCEEVTKYEKLAKIGQGTFGEVFKARDKKTKTKIVALKKVLMENEKEGFPITALREIRILQLLRHENIVNLIEICRSKASSYNKNKSTFYLVFDFCEHDLAGLLSNFNVKFSLSEIKKVMQQMFEGLFYIHSNKIIHRDMKAANILITKFGILKLADFGLARAISINKNNQPNRYTNRVVTLWYRPPELLLGERNYGSAVDMWGAGCIMAEMWTRSPIMQGNTEQHQLTLIAQLCGSITTDVWPTVNQLELYSKLDLHGTSSGVSGSNNSHGGKGGGGGSGSSGGGGGNTLIRRRVQERLRPYVKDPYAVDLLDKLLCLDPSARIDSNSALDNDFFWSDPMPVSLSKMLSNHTQSMFEFLAPRRLPGGGAAAAAAASNTNNSSNNNAAAAAQVAAMNSLQQQQAAAMVSQQQQGGGGSMGHVGHNSHQQMRQNAAIHHSHAMGSQQQQVQMHHQSRMHPHHQQQQQHNMVSSSSSQMNSRGGAPSGNAAASQQYHQQQQHHQQQHSGRYQGSVQQHQQGGPPTAAAAVAQMRFHSSSSSGDVRRMQGGGGHLKSGASQYQSSSSSTSTPDQVAQNAAAVAFLQQQQQTADSRSRGVQGQGGSHPYHSHQGPPFTASGDGSGVVGGSTNRQQNNSTGYMDRVF